MQEQIHKIPLKLRDKIVEECNTYLQAIKETSQYGDLTKEEQKELGAFFTPPELTIQMLEMYDFDSLEDFATYDVLDPTCGSGNLIIAALIVGSSVDPKYPEKVFGNELSPKTLSICRKRFVRYCQENNLKDYDEDFWEWHIHQGNALNPYCIHRLGFDISYRYDAETDKVFWDGRERAIEKSLGNLEKYEKQKITLENKKSSAKKMISTLEYSKLSEEEKTFYTRKQNNKSGTVEYLLKE